MFCTKCGARLSITTDATAIQSEKSDEILVSKSSKEEEEKILQELKDALKGVQEPQPSTPTPLPSPPRLSLKAWAVGGFVALLALLMAGLFLLHHRSTETQPVPPSSTLVESATPSPTVPAEAEAETRSTVGKMAAILEAIDHYVVTRKSLPATLTSLNKSYSDMETLKDGWGHNISYLVDLTNKTFVIQIFSDVPQIFNRVVCKYLFGRQCPKPKFS